MVLDFKNTKKELEIIESENQELKTQASALRNKMQANKEESEVINESVYSLAKKLREINQDWVPNTKDSTSFMVDVIEFASNSLKNEGQSTGSDSRL